MAEQLCTRLQSELAGCNSRSPLFPWVSSVFLVFPASKAIIKSGRPLTFFNGGGASVGLRSFFKESRFLRGFSRDDAAQVSAELIIVIAAVIAVAILLILQLQNTAKKGSKIVGQETDKAFGEIAEITNKS